LSDMLKEKYFMSLVIHFLKEHLSLTKSPKGELVNTFLIEEIKDPDDLSLLDAPIGWVPQKHKQGFLILLEPNLKRKKRFMLLAFVDQDAEFELDRVELIEIPVKKEWREAFDKSYKNTSIESLLSKINNPRGFIKMRRLTGSVKALSGGLPSSSRRH